MAIHTITKGLDVPIAGKVDQSTILPAEPTKEVAIMAEDYFFMKPRILENVGATVKRGQPLFEDRKNPGVVYTSVASGTVKAINRGDRRALISFVIELNEREQTGQLTDDDYFPFSAYKGNVDHSADELEALLLESGLWTALRERPFNRAPEVGTRPEAMFLTCTDTDPLCADVNKLLEGNEDDFLRGATALAKFADKTYLCVGPNTNVPKEIKGTQLEEFRGKHPAGLVGTHINTLNPVTRKRRVWHIHLQDIIAIGSLLLTGKLHVERVAAVAGPPLNNGYLIKTRVGAPTKTLLKGKFSDDEHRVISGSALSGRTAQAKDIPEAYDYMGRFHRQITVLQEGREREFIGWLLPGANKFSSIPIFLSALFGGKKFSFTTSTNGEEREMVPIGMYERVMPLDILPTFLLRAMEVQDLDRAEKLGALELDEEDLALCSFVCPGKQDYGKHLRRTLESIYKEG
ncbi:MAG: Na(+)-translocating NADH-quinone reductase subunit A [Myxococcota bacterium]